MSQPSLSAKMSDLQGEIGDYLGWGRGSDNGDEEWSDFKLSEIEKILDKAIRWVYFEATLDPRTPPYQWSWLNFSVSLHTASGVKYIDLPDDFGGFAANALSVTRDDVGGIYSKIKLIGEPYIDEKYAMASSVSGRPLFAADRALKGVTETSSVRRQIYIYPTPDAVYSIRGPYNVLPNRLTAKAPYTYGGADVSGCFIAACRAAAEIYKDKIQPGAGTEWPMFQRSLAAAIMRDGARHQPQSLGRNLDTSDGSRKFGRGWWSDGTIASVDPVTYDGTLFD